MGTQRTLRRAVSDEDKQQRREQILAAAKQVFAEKGFHETTIADVARGAGLSYGVVYWYFDSKEELFQALMSAEESALRGRISVALAASEARDTAGLLREAVRTTFEYFEDDRAATRLLFRDTSGLGDRFEQHLFGIFGRFITDVEAMVLDGQEKGLLKVAPPRLVAYSCAVLIGQVALRRQLTDDDLSAAEAADFTVDLLLDGMISRADAHPREERTTHS
jgi:AcrR family transcriptional regulator